MAISGTSDATKSAESTAALPSPITSSATKMRDDFLKLFVAQLEHQDPLSPQDNGQFVAQLAQMAQLEQAATTNTNLQAIEAAQSTAAGASLASMVGQTVTVSAQTVQLDGKGGALPLAVQTSAAAAKVSVVVKDIQGKELSRIEAPASSTGTTSITWNGTDTEGNPLPPGAYTLEAVGMNAANEELEALPVLTGALDGIRFVGGIPGLRFGSATVSPNNVIQIGA